MPTVAIDAVRKNHALEHATVAVLLERGVSPPLGGYSLPNGFIIWAKAAPGDVSNAAHEALQLLEEGHSDLAVSSYCGTNFVAAALLGGLAALVAGQGRGLWPRVRGAAVGLLVASARESAGGQAHTAQAHDPGASARDRDHFRSRPEEFAHIGSMVLHTYL